MILCEGELPPKGWTSIVLLRVEADGTIRNVLWMMPAGTVEALPTEEWGVRYLRPALEELTR